MDSEIKKKAIYDLLIEILKEEENEHDKVSFEILKKKRKICIPNMEILKEYRYYVKKGIMPEEELILRLLRKQRARSISGISAITILTKPFGCPGKCVYCPTEARMPKSYLSDEPAVMRAVLNGWDPKKQVRTRVKALYDMGHPVDKCEMIILGGTFSAYNKKYIHQYVLDMYNQLNGESSETMEEAQLKNEISDHRAVGLSIETRPDHIDAKEIKRLRALGVTKIEMGVQSLYDDILDLIKRGHRIAESVRATKMLKDAGFKIHYHMMPNLPGSNIERDVQMFHELFNNPDFKPDMLKIYPCVVTVHSELQEWENKGKYKSPSDTDVVDMLIRIKKEVPEYCRIMRLGRDIPAPDIVSGNRITNIREVVREKMNEKGVQCVCQRCREVGFVKGVIKDVELYRFDYEASGGKEIYLEIRSKVSNTILAFARLRIPSFVLEGSEPPMEVLRDRAMIREVHTYGFAVQVDKKISDASQHKGYGKQLVAEAERIAKEEFGLNQIGVISGIGVRGYYRKLGYDLEDSYMVKAI